jgi:2-furoyl-CoA dehydrogenase large subunit
MVQRVAVELGLDPLEVIRRNLIDADAFPYRAPAGALYDSGNYQAAVQQAEHEGGLAELRERRDQARREGRLYGIGYAAIVEPSISNMGYITTAMTPQERAKAGPKNGATTSATINIDGLGSVSVMIDSVPQGQGHRTVIAQVVADALGLEPEDITVNTEHDTQKDSWSIAAGNYSSRFAGAVAGTAHLAAQKMRAKLADIAADILKVSPDELTFSGRKIYSALRPDEKLPFHRVAGTAHWAPGTLPPGMTPGLRETVFWTPPQLTAPDENDVINSSAVYGFVFDICGLEVDLMTGKIRIDRYVSLHDAGTILNPALADGQSRGGFAQGVGAALMEEFSYGEDGSFLAGTFADYLVPTCCEVPDLRILHMQTPSPFTPLGSKGIGEGNNMSTPVCIANAVADALGVSDIRLPLTPSRVHDLLASDDPPPRGGHEMPTPFQPAKAGRSGLALTMSGSVDLKASPQQVYDVLLDPQALARVVPGCHSLTRVADNHYRAEVTMGVGLVKARYVAEIRLSDLDPPHALSLGGSGLSALGSVEGEGRVRLDPHEDGTRLHYDYGVSVNGKVAAVGSRMLEGAARIVLRQLFEQLGRQAGGESTSGAPRLSWWRRLLNWVGGSK